MVIEITQKHIWILLVIAILYCVLMVTVFFMGKDIGYNEGLEFRRDELDAIKEDLERILEEPTISPDTDITF